MQNPDCILIFLPLCQLDLMTEKWVVVAAVEVMLRFPLMPGEDPRTRCVSSKRCQPSGDRPRAASRRHEDQEERWDECQGVTRAGLGGGDSLWGAGVACPRGFVVMVTGSRVKMHTCASASHQIPANLCRRKWQVFSGICCSMKTAFSGNPKGKNHYLIGLLTGFDKYGEML